MMERTTLLTVQGGPISVDMELPNAVAIYDLLPTLLAALSLGTGNRTLDNAEVWGLGKPNAPEPFAAGLTLMEAGVFDGEILCLQDMAAWRRGPQVARPMQPPAPQDEHGFGVRWGAVDL